MFPSYSSMWDDHSNRHNDIGYDFPIDGIVSLILACLPQMGTYTFVLDWCQVLSIDDSNWLRTYTAMLHRFSGCRIVYMDNTSSIHIPWKTSNNNEERDWDCLMFSYFVTRTKLNHLQSWPYIEKQSYIEVVDDQYMRIGLDKNSVSTRQRDRWKSDHLCFDTVWVAQGSFFIKFRYVNYEIMRESDPTQMNRDEYCRFCDAGDDRAYWITMSGQIDDRNDPKWHMCPPSITIAYEATDPNWTATVRVLPRVDSRVTFP